MSSSPLYLGDDEEPSAEALIAWEDLVEEVLDPEVHGGNLDFVMHLARVLEEAAMDLRVAAARINMGLTD